MLPSCDTQISVSLDSYDRRLNLISTVLARQGLVFNTLSLVNPKPYSRVPWRQDE